MFLWFLLCMTDLHEVVGSEVFIFLCVGNFGVTTGRPIQSYGSGAGTRDGGRV